MTATVVSVENDKMETASNVRIYPIPPMLCHQAARRQNTMIYKREPWLPARPDYRETHGRIDLFVIRLSESYDTSVGGMPS